MNRQILTCGLLASVGLLSGCAQLDARNAARQPPPPPARPPGPPRPELALETPLCPVTGRPVNFLIRTTGPDGCVYFCSKDCVTTYAADSQTYADGVAWQREILSYRPRVQVRCPVSGDPADPETFTDLCGERVYFCKSCSSCGAKYEAHPEQYAAALEACYTYQTRCPVTGVKIDPNAYARTASGAPIYFCCDACAGKLRSDPAKYALNLEEQGIKPDPKMLKD